MTRGRPTLVADCVTFYAIPNEFDTHEEYRRRHHLDLPHLADEALWSEQLLLRLTLTLDDPRSWPWYDYDGAWLRERLDRVREEQRRRLPRVDGSRPRRARRGGVVAV